MLCTEMARNELVHTLVANDIPVNTLAAITQGSVVASPHQRFSARLRALSRMSNTIRYSLGGPDGALTP